MSTIRRNFPAFTIACATLGVALALPAATGPRFNRPTVQVSVTATGNGPLRYQWRSTDGSISDVDAPTTSWTLPSGPGLHFAYVLVSDRKGGYTEGRIAVNTDALGTAPDSLVVEPRTLVAPAAPARVGDTFRGQLGYENAIGCYSYNGCDAYAPGIGVYLVDANGARHPSTGSVTTDPLGQFAIPGVAPGFVNIYCNLADPSTFVSCGGTYVGSIAFTNYFPYYPAANNYGYYSGSVSLADFNHCGANDELFGVHRSAKVTLLDANNMPLASARVDGFGNYAFGTAVANAVTTRFSCEGTPSSPQPNPGGNFQFPNTGAPAITAMTAPLNGSPGVFLGGIPSPQNLSYDDLADKGVDSRAAACQYYQAIGAVQECEDNGRFEGAVSYQDWQRSVHIGPYAREGGVRAHATYVNAVDLNLTRVHDSIRYGTTSLATVVCNHKGPTTSVDDAVRNAIAGKDLIACVAMDYQLNPGVNGNQKFVRFYIFGPSGQLLPSVNLDGRGEKFMPGVCVSCHGGEHYAGHYPDNGTGYADFGGHMLPYDKGNFEFSNVDGLTDAQREGAIYALNQNLLAVDPPKSPKAEGALTVAGQGLISGWYANSHTLNQSYVPQSWQDFDKSYVIEGGGNPITSSDPTNLFYRRVVARTCRTCHVNQENYNFEVPDEFQYSPSMVARTICGSNDGYDVNHLLSNDLTMPNSVVTYDRFWSSQGTTDPVTGESTDMPQIFNNFMGPFEDGYDLPCGSPPYPHYFF